MLQWNQSPYAQGRRGYPGVIILISNAPKRIHNPPSKPPPMLCKQRKREYQARNEAHKWKYLTLISSGVRGHGKLALELNCGEMFATILIFS